LGSVSFALSKYTVSGYVKDARTGEALIGAIIYIKEIPSAVTSTNNYGFYSITLKEGKYSVIGQFVGYGASFVDVSLTESKRIDFNLNEKVTELNEVIVTAEKRNENVTRTQMSVNQINIQEIKNIPAFMGEKDVLKTIQLLPGVKPVGEGNSGFYVRGGSADENLILLDEANVYNASHLLGFFSVFNPDAIKDVTLYKGTMPAEYGGRLSSVLDISMNDGNNKSYEANGGIGLISSRLTADGPIVKDKGSFIISARRTYADLFAKLSSDTVATCRERV
jgi:TonB-dependent Receptor Plug Domain.